MKIIYTLAAIAVIFSIGAITGWTEHETHQANQILKIQKDAVESYRQQKAAYEKDKLELENRIAKDNANSESRIRKLIAENNKLQNFIDLPVDPELLVYARLCDTPADCAVLRRPAVSLAESQGIAVGDILYVVRALDTAIEKHNLEVAHQSEQIKVCR